MEGFFLGAHVISTLTDSMVADEIGTTRAFETPTSKDVQTGVMDAVALAAEGFELSLNQFCTRIERFGHGTTAGLNALVTGSGARAAILTTRGFTDMLEIGRLTRQSTGLNEHEYTNSFLRNRHALLVPRERILEIDERIDITGRIIKPLDEAQARAAIRALAERNIEAVAICTSFATVNPVHEQRLREVVGEELPHAFVSVSHEVSPGVGEYARMSTTAAKAALGPIAGRYLSEFEHRLKAAGLRVPTCRRTSAAQPTPNMSLTTYVHRRR